eukprot:329848-Rhodomonas_salina.1
MIKQRDLLFEEEARKCSGLTEDGLLLADVRSAILVHCVAASCKLRRSLHKPTPKLHTAAADADLLCRAGESGEEKFFFSCGFCKWESIAAGIEANEASGQSILCHACPHPHTTTKLDLKCPIRFLVLTCYA